MYMLQMPQLFDPKGRAPPWRLRLEYRMGLLALIRSFCNLITRIESDQLFYHKLSGKRRPWELLVRRNVDFLAICVLNGFSWQDSESHFEYVQTLSIVQKVFSTHCYYLEVENGADVYPCRRHLALPLQKLPRSEIVQRITWPRDSSVHSRAMLATISPSSSKTAKVRLPSSRFSVRTPLLSCWKVFGLQQPPRQKRSPAKLLTQLMGNLAIIPNWRLQRRGPFNECGEQGAGFFKNDESSLNHPPVKRYRTLEESATRS